MHRIPGSATRVLKGIGFLSTVNWVSSSNSASDPLLVEHRNEEILMNWSGTHTSGTKHKIWFPNTTEDTVNILRQYSLNSLSLRPVGSCLSPNGLGIPKVDGDSICLAHMKEIKVNKHDSTVTVGAGVLVDEVLHVLKEHGLTLENFSSIKEQQLAGWTQVAAHGTGCTLSTVDDMITSMKVAVPALPEAIVLSETDPLFPYFRVGLGSLGVVTELTLRCIPELQLHETTHAWNISAFCAALQSPASSALLEEHRQRLLRHRHVRYMWFPYTDSVLGVQSHPAAGCASVSARGSTEPLQALAAALHPQRAEAMDLSVLSFAQLRDFILDALGERALDPRAIAVLNEAEAAYWRSCEGAQRVGSSNDMLGFDCGGQQWVFEVCFPIGDLHRSYAETGYRDVAFVQRLLERIEELQIAAPAPIEMRWTGRSPSPLSPAYSDRPDDVFCWVGVIMYIPASFTDIQRLQLADRFREYAKAMRPLCEEFRAVPHWAKIESPREQLYQQWLLRCALQERESVDETAALQRCKRRLVELKRSIDAADGSVADTAHPIDADLIAELHASQDHLRRLLSQTYGERLQHFLALQERFDPQHVLSNSLIDELRILMRSR